MKLAIQRYSDIVEIDGSVRMEPTNLGEWVRYEDVEAAFNTVINNNPNPRINREALFQEICGLYCWAKRVPFGLDDSLEVTEARVVALIETGIRR